MMHHALHIAITEQKGWGVFTKEFIARNTLLEISPVIIMNAEEFDILNKTKLHDYVFFWEGDYCCMAMGYVPIYNHGSPSNCEYYQDYKNGVIEIKAIRDIKEGEELTINYQGEFDSKQEVWFPMLP